MKTRAPDLVQPPLLESIVTRTIFTVHCIWVNFINASVDDRAKSVRVPERSHESFTWRVRASDRERGGTRRSRWRYDALVSARRDRSECANANGGSRGAGCGWRRPPLAPCCPLRRAHRPRAPSTRRAPCRTSPRRRRAALRRCLRYSHLTLPQQDATTSTAEPTSVPLEICSFIDKHFSALSLYYNLILSYLICYH